jgi:hypothetical protein
MTIRGNTAAMGLDEMVAFLTRSGLEGVLEIASGRRRLRVFVHSGRLLCRCDDPRMTPARGTPQVSSKSTARRSKPGSGSIDRKALTQLLTRAETLRTRDSRERLEKDLPAMLRWDDANYTFVPRRLPRGLVRDLERTGLVVDPTAVVMEAARQKDEGRSRRSPKSRRTNYESCSRSGTRLTRRPRTKRDTRRRKRRPQRRVLRGDLRGVGLPALLQDLRTTQRTGTLAVTAGGCTEQIHFHRGDAYLLDTVDEGEAFVHYLVGDKGAETLSELAGQQLHEDELDADRQRELKGRFLDMLFWEDASFSFEAGELPLEFYVPCPRTTKIKLDTERFLLSAIGAMEEWDCIRRAVGGARAVLRFRDPEQKLACVRRYGDYLTLIDGQRSFDDLVRRAGVDRLEAGRTLARLVRALVVSRS